jgi:hypothetical protein
MLPSIDSGTVKKVRKMRILGGGIRHPAVIANYQMFDNQLLAKTALRCMSPKVRILRTVKSSKPTKSSRAGYK